MNTLAQIAATSPRQIRSCMDEPINATDFANHISGARELFCTLSVKSADLFAKKILSPYAAVRALAPDTVVETGLADGVSSAYRLLPLQKKGKGCLHPIGLARAAFLPRGKHLGWLVPQ
jgi:hypothetical protein